MYLGAVYLGSYLPAARASALPEYLDFTSNLVREFNGMTDLDRMAEGTVMLTRAIAGTTDIDRMYATDSILLADELLAVTVTR